MIAYEKLLALPPRETHGAYSERDTILYALGLGVGARDPLDAAALRYTYERGLQALPTMAVVLAHPGFFIGDPQYGFDWAKILHGEQRLELHRPLPASGKVRSLLTLDEVYDKGAGKGALLYATRRIHDAGTDEPLATLGATYFMRGDGGAGGSTAKPPSPHPIPDRPAEHRVTAGTRRDQALLYRLSGDMNPLHVDPAVAQRAGFERPILHGLCTYGIVALAAMEALCGGEMARLRRFDVRFTGIVLPGDTIEIEIWNDGPGQAALRATVAERGTPVIGNGLLQFAGDVH
jgi:acyl dehydratase